MLTTWAFSVSGAGFHPPQDEQPSMAHEEEQPITTGSVVRWTHVAFAAIGNIIIICAFIFNMNSNINQIRLENHDAISAVEVRLTRDEADIENSRKHQESSDKSIQDLQSKLDVAVTILQRLDHKINGP